MRWAFTLVLIVSAVFLTNITNAENKNRKPAAASDKATISDVVVKMRDDDEGVVVLFSKNTGSYYLKLATANFDNLRKKLDQSLKEKKAITVTADSSLNILEVK